MRILLCIRNKIRICVNFIEYTQQKSHFYFVGRDKTYGGSLRYYIEEVATRSSSLPLFLLGIYRFRARS